MSHHNRRAGFSSGGCYCSRHRAAGWSSVTKRGSISPLQEWRQVQRMSRNTEYSCVIQIHTAHTMAEQAAETHRSWADNQQATERAPRGPSCCLPCLCLSLIRQSRQRMYTVQHVTHRGGYILLDHLSVSYPAVMTLVLTFHLTLVYPVRCWVFSSQLSQHPTYRLLSLAPVCWIAKPHPSNCGW